MCAKKHFKKPPAAVMTHLDKLLDEALEETFPASDPVAINVEIETFERIISTVEQRRIAPKGISQSGEE
jgi:hypothetical protein